MEENNKSKTLIVLGKNIRKIRLSKNITQETLACDIDKSVNFVSLVENGKTGISVQTLVDICRSLGTDFNSMFTGIITPTDTNDNDFIISSLNFFNDVDKSILKELVTYINNSKK